jgi:hypothetical protein
VTLLRQIEVSMSQGKAAPIACRDAGMACELLPISYLTRPINAVAFSGFFLTR